MSAFQSGAFQTDAFQVDAASGTCTPAFQSGAFQNDAFQICYSATCTPAFQTNAFQYNAFQTCLSSPSNDNRDPGGGGYVWPHDEIRRREKRIAREISSLLRGNKRKRKKIRVAVDVVGTDDLPLIEIMPSVPLQQAKHAVSIVAEYNEAVLRIRALREQLQAEKQRQDDEALLYILLLVA